MMITYRRYKFSGVSPAIVGLVGFVLLTLIPTSALAPAWIGSLSAAIIGGFAEEFIHGFLVVSFRSGAIIARVTNVRGFPIAFSIELPNDLTRRQMIAVLVGGPGVVVCWCGVVLAITTASDMISTVSPVAVAAGAIVSLSSLIPFRVGDTFSDMAQVRRVLKG